LRKFLINLDLVIKFCEKDQFPDVSFIGLQVNPANMKIITSTISA